MKFITTTIAFIFYSCCAMAQNDFIGIARYKLTVEGSSDAKTDSMAVVFDKDRVKIILYIPGDEKMPVREKYFIDDFKKNISYNLNSDAFTYTTDSLKSTLAFEFINTNKFSGVNNYICFEYKADPRKIDITKVTSAECLASVDFSTSAIKDYSFFGVQPIIVDNRLVMDFTVKQKDGNRPRIYLYDIKRLDSVDSYFDLSKYTLSAQ